MLMFCLFCLSALVYPQNDPQLESVYFRTYDRVPTSAGALPIDKFPRPTATFVYAEVDFKNLLYNVRDQEYTLTFKWYLEDGQKIGENSSSFYVKKEDINESSYSKWGWDEPGRWLPGRYTVELWINETRFAVKEFAIIGYKAG